MSVSNHLLRTFAAVPPNTVVLDANCQQGKHTIPLLQLGFTLIGMNVHEQFEAHVEATIGEPLGNVAAFHATELGDLTQNTFDWIILDRFFQETHPLDFQLNFLKILHWTMKAGAWIYMATPAKIENAISQNGMASFAKYTPESLNLLMQESGFVVAEAPHFEMEHDPILVGIYRKVETETIG